ncbi:hypothetical protein [Streptomyces sp. SID12501]|uniref:Uncharacterized protein n=1 Tax=Streptomyces sp. SID12501 TaxID=2706042 RepID=A0A6B3BLD5_9ACTN|nr:hypothetical protein [Streptomyces sp. SID12501]NEC84959.1 hypothetical protein [Streptomyces sp. SID12501]
MGRRFKDMQTPEQQYAAQQAARRADTPAPSRPVAAATHREWVAMSAHQQAAHLARLDGREDEARRWEQQEAKLTTPAPKKRGWFR